MKKLFITSLLSFFSGFVVAIVSELLIPTLGVELNQCYYMRDASKSPPVGELRLYISDTALRSEVSSQLQRDGVYLRSWVLWLTAERCNWLDDQQN